MRRVLELSLAAAALVSTPSLLVAREERPRTATGTVQRMNEETLDVKGADGEATVFRLTAKTKVLRGETVATMASVKPGERVTVEFEEASGGRTALRVRVVERPLSTHYTCSMHPEVVSDTPGKCPKCGMNLTAVEPSKK
jgi:hypothetical protein